METSGRGMIYQLFEFLSTLQGNIRSHAVLKEEDILVIGQICTCLISQYFLILTYKLAE